MERSDRIDLSFFNPKKVQFMKSVSTLCLPSKLLSYEEVLISKAADFGSISRPLIHQPDLPILWHSGEGPEGADVFPATPACQ